MMAAFSPVAQPTGPQRPKAVLLDVNQTLFSLEPLRQRFRDVGLHGPQDLEVCTLPRISPRHPSSPGNPTIPDTFMLPDKDCAA
jgi:hypothetical protein